LAITAAVQPLARPFQPWRPRRAFRDKGTDRDRNQQGQEPTGAAGDFDFFSFLDKHRGNEEPFCINETFSKLRRLGASFDLVECMR